MHKVTISDKSHARLVEFKRVFDTVMDEEMSFDEYVETVLLISIDHMLADLMAPLEHSTLVRSFQQLGSEHPEQVYGYVAETLRRGAYARGREEMKQWIGFRARPGAGDDTP